MNQNTIKGMLQALSVHLEYSINATALPHTTRTNNAARQCVLSMYSVCMQLIGCEVVV